MGMGMSRVKVKVKVGLGLRLGFLRSDGKLWESHKPSM